MHCSAYKQASLPVPTTQIGSSFVMGTIKLIQKHSDLHVLLYSMAIVSNLLNYSYYSNWFLICYGTTKALWKDSYLYVIIYFNGHFSKWHITLLQLYKISTQEFMVGGDVILFPFPTGSSIWMHMFYVSCRYVQPSVLTY